jgi:two-component system phosphate regulon sensor histidine kinase PhoR
MDLRYIGLILWWALGAGLASWLSPQAMKSELAWVGSFVALTAWFMWDQSKVNRIWSWLRNLEDQSMPPQSGYWAELVGRIRRLLRDRDQSLVESRRRLDDFLLALQASPNGVMLLSENDRIEWFNQTSAGHFGLDPQRDLVQTIGNLVREPAFAHYLARRDFSQSVVMYGRRSTAAKPVRLAVQMHPYAGGRALLLSVDVTALEQAESMRREFVANVSHEIRTPLTVVSGFVETLQNLELGDVERKHYLDLMAQQTERMQTLVNDLLMLSRLEGSAAPTLTKWCDVQDLMYQLEQDAWALSHVMGASTAQVLNFDCAFKGQIAGASTELLSAMGNLVSNAVRYTPAGGHIDVSLLAAADAGLRFTVKDTGPGIASEHLGRLTERFYRVDRSRSRDTGGTGLGLAIVKHVAQRHDATLDITSTLGRGSSFSLHFPPQRVKAEAAGA